MPPKWREIASADSSGVPFQQLSHLVYDSYMGELFAVDHLRCTVFKITFLSGKQKAIAGASARVVPFCGSGQSGYANGAGAKAQFSLPSGIAFDDRRWLYVADTTNHVIRKINTLGVNTTTAPATGAAAAAAAAAAANSGAGASGAGAAAGNSAQSITTLTGVVVNLLAGVTGTKTGGRVDSSTATTAQFSWPHGLLAVPRFTVSTPASFDTKSDETMTLLVSDQNNNLIRAVNMTNAPTPVVKSVSTYAGNFGAKAGGLVGGTALRASFRAPVALACDLDGIIYVADSENSCIRKIAVDPASGGAGLVSIYVGGPLAAKQGITFESPSALAIDTDYTLYVADKRQLKVVLRLGATQIKRELAMTWPRAQSNVLELIGAYCGTDVGVSVLREFEGDVAGVAVGFGALYVATQLEIFAINLPIKPVTSATAYSLGPKLSDWSRLKSIELNGSDPVVLFPSAYGPQSATAAAPAPLGAGGSASSSSAAALAGVGLRQVGGLGSVMYAGSAGASFGGSVSGRATVSRFAAEQSALNASPINALRSMFGLERLSLCDCKLKLLPVEVTQLSQLTALDVSRNQLDALPTDLHVRLPRLRVLRAAHNNLKQLPSTIGLWQNVTELQFHRNKLATLPFSLGLLYKKLTLLTLDGNPFGAIPATIKATIAPDDIIPPPPPPPPPLPPTPTTPAKDAAASTATTATNSTSASTAAASTNSPSSASSANASAVVPVVDLSSSQPKLLMLLRHWYLNGMSEESGAVQLFVLGNSGSGKSSICWLLEQEKSVASGGSFSRRFSSFSSIFGRDDNKQTPPPPPAAPTGAVRPVGAGPPPSGATSGTTPSGTGSAAPAKATPTLKPSGTAAAAAAAAEAAAALPGISGGATVVNTKTFAAPIEVPTAVAVHEFERKRISWRLWDMPSGSEYRHMNSLFITGGSVAVVCVDLTPKVDIPGHRLSQCVDAVRFLSRAMSVSTQLTSASAVHTASTLQAHVSIILVGTHSDCLPPPPDLPKGSSSAAAAAHASAQRELETTPWLTPADYQVLNSVVARLPHVSVQPRWYRMNTLRPDSDTADDLREHTHRLATIVLRQRKIPKCIEAVQDWIDGHRQQAFPIVTMRELRLKFREVLGMGRDKNDDSKSNANSNATDIPRTGSPAQAAEEIKRTGSPIAGLPPRSGTSSPAPAASPSNSGTPPPPPPPPPTSSAAGKASPDITNRNLPRYANPTAARPSSVVVLRRDVVTGVAHTDRIEPIIQSMVEAGMLLRLRMRGQPSPLGASGQEPGAECVALEPKVWCRFCELICTGIAVSAVDAKNPRLSAIATRPLLAKCIAGLAGGELTDQYISRILGALEAMDFIACLNPRAPLPIQRYVLLPRIKTSLSWTPIANPQATGAADALVRVIGVRLVCSCNGSPTGVRDVCKSFPAIVRGLRHLTCDGVTVYHPTAIVLDMCVGVTAMIRIHSVKNCGPPTASSQQQHVQASGPASPKGGPMPIPGTPAAAAAAVAAAAAAIPATSDPLATSRSHVDIVVRIGKACIGRPNIANTILIELVQLVLTAIASSSSTVARDRNPQALCPACLHAPTYCAPNYPVGCLTWHESDVLSGRLLQCTAGKTLAPVALSDLETMTLPGLSVAAHNRFLSNVVLIDPELYLHPLSSSGAPDPHHNRSAETKAAPASIAEDPVSPKVVVDVPTANSSNPGTLKVVTAPNSNDSKLLSPGAGSAAGSAPASPSPADRSLISNALAAPESDAWDDSHMEEIRHLRHRTRIAGGMGGGVGVSRYAAAGESVSGAGAGSVAELDFLTPSSPKLPDSGNATPNSGPPSRASPVTVDAAPVSMANDTFAIASASTSASSNSSVPPSLSTSSGSSSSGDRKPLALGSSGSASASPPTASPGSAGSDLFIHSKLGSPHAGTAVPKSFHRSRGQASGGSGMYNPNTVVQYSSATYENRDWDGRYVLPSASGSSGGESGVLEMTAPRVVTVKEIRRVHRTNLHGFIEQVRREIEITSFITSAVLSTGAATNTLSGAISTTVMTGSRSSQSVMPYIMLMHGAWPVLPVPSLTFERFEGGSVRSLMTGWASAAAAPPPPSQLGGPLPPPPEKPLAVEKPIPGAAPPAAGSDAPKKALPPLPATPSRVVPQAPLLLRLKWLWQLAQAIDFVHTHHIVHRAIIPENVLISADLQSVKLTNFSQAKRLQVDTQFTNTVGGTTIAEPFYYERRGMGSTGTHYDAPEMVNGAPGVAAASAGAAATQHGVGSGGAGGSGVVAPPAMMMIDGKTTASAMAVNQAAAVSNAADRGVVIATGAVDIYSFGVLAKELNTTVRIPVLYSYTATLAESCMNVIPSKRPTAAQIVEKLSLLLGIPPTFRALDLMKANRSASSIGSGDAKYAQQQARMADPGSHITRPVDIKFDLQQHAGVFRYQNRVLWISEKEKSIRFIAPNGTTVEFPFSAFSSVSRQQMEYLYNTITIFFAGVEAPYQLKFQYSSDLQSFVWIVQNVIFASRTRDRGARGGAAVGVGAGAGAGPHGVGAADPSLLLNAARVDLSDRIARNQLAKTLSEAEAGEYVEHKVTLLGGTVSHARIVVIYGSKKTFSLLNTQRQLRHEYPLSSVLSFEVPMRDAQNPLPQLFIVFKETGSQSHAKQQIPIYLEFADEVSRFTFCERMCALHPAIDFFEEADEREHPNPDEMRFVVHVDSRKHVLSLLSSRVVRVFDPTKRYVDTPFENIVTLESGVDDRSKLTLHLRNGRAKLTLSFIDSAARERFLVQFRTLNASGSLSDGNARALSMFVSTWNVGSLAFFPTDQIDTYLPSGGVYDIYVFGYQECPKPAVFIEGGLKHLNHSLHASNAAAAAAAKEAASAAAPGSSGAMAGGGPGANSGAGLHRSSPSTAASASSAYSVLVSVKLWEIVLVVYVHSSVLARITNVECDTVSCGVGNVLGNKGAVASSFSVDDSSFVFVCAHLAARATRVKIRRDNVIKIFKHLRVGRKDVDILHQFDHVIFLGDLNYRTDHPFDSVCQLMEHKKWSAIAEHDQLKKQMTSRAVFTGFKELPLEFSPTYRFERKENTVSNKKNQSPSWCDRILFQSSPGLNEYALRADQYDAAMQCFGSDHRPVWASFWVRTRTHFDRTTGWRALAQRYAQGFQSTTPKFLPSGALVSGGGSFGKPSGANLTSAKPATAGSAASPKIAAATPAEPAVDPRLFSLAPLPPKPATAPPAAAAATADAKSTPATAAKPAPAATAVKAPAPAGTAAIPAPGTTKPPLPSSGSKPLPSLPPNSSLGKAGMVLPVSYSGAIANVLPIVRSRIELMELDVQFDSDKSIAAAGGISNTGSSPGDDSGKPITNTRSSISEIFDSKNNSVVANQQQLVLRFSAPFLNSDVEVQPLDDVSSDRRSSIVSSAVGTTFYNALIVPLIGDKDYLATRQLTVTLLADQDGRLMVLGHGLLPFRPLIVISTAGDTKAGTPPSASGSPASGSPASGSGSPASGSAGGAMTPPSAGIAVKSISIPFSVPISLGGVSVAELTGSHQFTI